MGSMRGNAGHGAVHVRRPTACSAPWRPGLFGFGVSLAFEREQGLLTFKQALPMPPGAYLLARAWSWP